MWKIVKIGDFSSEGGPTGWSINFEKPDPLRWVLGIDIKGRVNVNGIEIVEWTELRNRRMGKCPAVSVCS